MITASEEAFLVDVIDEWRARQRWAETRSTQTPSDLSDVDKNLLIGRFAAVVLDLAGGGWISVEEESLPLVGDELHATLDDPHCWISTINGDHRMVMLITTNAWNDLFASRHSP